MKILVTGGSGFIGSHLIHKLLEHGHKVVAFTNTNETITETIKVDLADYSKVLNSLPEGLDCVFHLGSKVYRPNYKDLDPHNFSKVNTLGTLNLLKACKQKGCKKFIYGSTFAVYGSCNSLPVNEDRYPNPLNFYSASKFAGELYTNLYSKTGLLKCINLRLGYVYGPGMNKAFVPSRFMLNAIKAKDLELIGNGQASSDFIYIDDVIEAFLCTLKKGIGTYNIGTGKEVEILKLAKTIIDVTDSKSKLSFRVGKTQRFCMDVRKSMKELGFYPKFDLKLGIKSYFNNI